MKFNSVSVKNSRSSEFVSLSHLKQRQENNLANINISVMNGRADLEGYI